MESEARFRKRLAAAENMAVRSRNYRRARERALTALARLHKEDYLGLLEIEKKKDEQEGKSWNSLADNLPSTRLDIPTDYANTDRRDTSTNPQNESHNV